MTLYYCVINVLVLTTLCSCGVRGFLLNTPKPGAVHYRCNFETTNCGYTSRYTSGGAYWVRHEVSFGLPIIEHTYNKVRHGHVMHVAGGSKGIANRSVNLTSPLYTGFQPSEHVSIGFWYTFIRSPQQQPMRLNVYVDGTTHSANTPVYSSYRSYNSTWRHVCATVSVVTNLAVTFEMVPSHTGLTGDFAIDDVTLEPGYSCSSTTSSITTHRPYVTTTTDSVQPVWISSVTCDFEDSHICGYQATNVPGDKFDWLRHKGTTVSSLTGPTVDHTTGTSIGYYMYIETSSPRQTGDNAKLVSPAFIPQGQQHVTFWYHGYGKSIGSLKVYAGHHGYLGSPLFEYSGPSSTAWKQGCVNIPLTSSSTSIVFEGIRGISYTGDIAIDDVTLEAGTCSSGTSGTISPSVATTHVPSPTSVATTDVSTPVTSTTSVTTTNTSPVNGGWTNWTTWSACSMSCDLGMISRSRSCTHPIPTNGGNKCNGTSIETHECSLGTCPVWSAWFDGPCSSTCGNGTMARMRSCSTGNNADCAGNSRDSIPCVGTECIR